MPTHIGVTYGWSVRLDGGVDQPGMNLGAGSRCGPVEASRCFGDGHVVDAGFAAPHQPALVELPPWSGIVWSAVSSPVHGRGD